MEDQRYTKDACLILQLRLSKDSDRLIIALCRIQMPSHNIATSLANRNSVGATNRESQFSPLDMLMASFQQRIRGFGTELPDDLIKSRTLGCNIHNTEALLYGHALDEPHQQQFLYQNSHISLL